MRMKIRGEREYHLLPDWGQKWNFVDGYFGSGCMRMIRSKVFPHLWVSQMKVIVFENL